MNDYTPLANNETLGPDQWQRVDNVCDRFEAAWQAGRRPRIEDYLAEVPSGLHALLLRELLALEIDYRSRAGERPAVDEYLARFPSPIVTVAFAAAIPRTGSQPCGPLPAWVVDRLVAETRGRIRAGIDNQVYPPDFVASWPGLAVATSVSSPLGSQVGHCGPNAATVPMLIRDQTATPTDCPPLPPMPAKGTFGDYELFEQIGKGGMGVVYRAYHKPTHRVVALKVIRADRLEYLSADKRRAWVERLRREAQAMARSEHPNVVTVYDVGEINGQPFYSMRYIEGRNLGDLLHDGPLPPRRAAAYLEVVARAVHHVHACGVLHRDLKPRNILVDAQDRPHVADFGLAKSLEAPPESGTLDGTAGTPGYMAPEQACPHSQVSVACDVYGLGATLYSLLTGRPPFQSADPVVTVRQVCDNDPVPPRQLNPAIDRDLELICLKCLRKEPEQRYASAEQLADELARFLDHRPLQHTRPVGRAERLWRWCRRNRAVAAISAAAIVLTLVGLAGAAAYHVQLRAAKADLEEKSKESATLMMGQGLMLCDRGEVQEGMLWLARSLEVAERARAGDLRRVLRQNLAGWQHHVSPLRGYFDGGRDIVVAALAPDRRTVLTGDRDGTARRWDAVTGKPLGEPMRHADPVNAVTFRPDGQGFATAAGDPSFCPNNQKPEARLFDLAAGGERSLEHKKGVLTAVFSPNGKVLLTGGWDMQANLWDVTTGALIRSLPHKGRLCAAAFRADGRLVVTQCLPPPELVFPQDDTLRHVAVWDVATGACQGNPFEHRQAVSALGFHEGKAVLATAEDTVVHVWQVEGKERLGQPLTHLRPVLAVAFSPDGALLLTGSQDGTARLWETATGKQVGPVLPHRTAVLGVAFEPEGKAFLTWSADGTVRVWGTPPVRERQQMLELADWRSTAVAFSPDGRRLATSSTDLTTKKGEVRFWNPTTGERLDVTIALGALVCSLAFSPDGKTLAVGTGDLEGKGGALELRDVETGQLRREPLKHPAFVQAVAFSPDGGLVLTGCGDSKARLWQVLTGEQVGKPWAHGHGIRCVAFSPHGKIAVTGGLDNRARLWDVASGRVLGIPLKHDAPVNAVAYSPDGKRILTGSGDPRWNTLGEVRQWEVESGRPWGRSLTLPGTVHAVAYSPDGTTALVGGHDQTVRFLDAATGDPIGPPLPHPHEVRALAFHPGGRMAFTGCLDGKVRSWDLPVELPTSTSQVRLWVETVSGMELNPKVGLRARFLDPAAWQQRRRDLEQTGSPLP